MKEMGEMDGARSGILFSWVSCGACDFAPESAVFLRIKEGIWRLGRRRKKPRLLPVSSLVRRKELPLYRGRAGREKMRLMM
jgi:hypothetical protein